MKEARLFVCHVEISQATYLLSSCDARDIVVKPLMSKGAPNWFHNVLTYGAEVIQY
jgi:hypothetical protein